MSIDKYYKIVDKPNQLKIYKRVLAGHGVMSILLPALECLACLFFASFAIFVLHKDFGQNFGTIIILLSVSFALWMTIETAIELRHITKTFTSPVLSIIDGIVLVRDNDGIQVKIACSDIMKVEGTLHEEMVSFMLGRTQPKLVYYSAFWLFPRKGDKILIDSISLSSWVKKNNNVIELTKTTQFIGRWIAKETGTSFVLDRKVKNGIKDFLHSKTKP